MSEDVAFRMLGWANFPAHRTISDLHLEEFGNLFVQVVRMAREAGLEVGTGGGWNQDAGECERKAMSYERMTKQETALGEQIRDLINRARPMEEDQRYGADQRGDELPEATHEKRRATIQAAMKTRRRLPTRKRKGNRETTSLEAARRASRSTALCAEPKPKAQDNFTDPESRIMKTSTEGFQQCYNAQAAVDAEARIIVATTVSNNASDTGQLHRLWMS